MNKVSLIIPYYNGQQFLADLLESIAFQSHTDTEVIIINDSSSSESLFS